MGKKLLVIFGIAAVAGYLFRDRIIATGLALVEKANGLFAEDDSDDLFLEEENHVS